MPSFWIDDTIQSTRRCGIHLQEKMGLYRIQFNPHVGVEYKKC